MNRLLRITVCTALFLFAAASAWAFGSKESSGGKDGAITVYTYDAFPESLETVIKEHMTAVLGTETVMKRFEDAGGLYTQLYLERNDPKADVMIGLDGTYLAKTFSNDLLLPYKPAGLVLSDPGLAVDGRYRAVPFDYGGVVLNYNSELLPDPPKTWEELLSPEYRGKILLASPATSSPGRNFLLFTVAKFGEDGYLEFWKRLKPNILTVTPGWSESYGLYTQGEAPIVLSYDTSPAYHIQFENDEKYKNLIIGDEAYAQVEVAGIIRGTKRLDAAKKLMDFLVSKEFQSLIPLNQIMYPVRPDIELPPAFAKAGRAGRLVTMDESKAAEKFDSWLAAWEAVMRS